MRNKSFMAAALMGALGAGSTALAADHIDGTTSTGGALADPSVDITDAFAWTSSDGNSVNLIMNVFPGATTTSLFSTTAKYVFHTQSGATYLAATQVKRDIICTFSGTAAPQTVSCWVTDPSNGNAVSAYVTGDATTAGTPLVAADSSITAFTGLRNDPFFFNLAGFRNATSTVAAAIKSYVGGDHTSFITGFDSNAPGCPILTTAARTTVAGRLGKDCTGAGTTPQDFFKKPDGNANPAACMTAPTLVTTATPNEGTTGNIMTIALQVKKSLLNTGGPVLGVWAATTK